MAINFLASAQVALVETVIENVTSEIIKQIKNKVSPGEIQQAILAGIKAASIENEKLLPEQHLFHSSKPDSFRDDKIEEFINYWYDSRYTDPQEAARCKDTLRKALEDNDRIKQLAKNPLLITIIALIHRYQAYLPKELHKLYDKAVETLLTSWDANKAISGHQVLQYLDLA